MPRKAAATKTTEDKPVTRAKTAKTAKPANLTAKLAEIQSIVKIQAKTGRNERQGYPYAEAPVILECVRHLLAQRHIVISKSFREFLSAQPAGKMTLYTILWVFTIHDGETGEEIECHWISQGADAGDKGINKASTAATKYFLIDLFKIPTGDVDADEHSPEVGPPAEPQRTPPPPPPSAGMAAPKQAPKQAPKPQDSETTATPQKANNGQLDAIKDNAKAIGLAPAKVNAWCKEQFGKTVKALSMQEAIRCIDWILAQREDRASALERKLDDEIGQAPY